MLIVIALWLQVLVVLVLCHLMLVVIVPITMKVICNSFYINVSSNYFIAANIVYGAKCGCNFLKDVNINSNFLTAIHQKCF